MKILKKIIYILALVLITSCGYEPIFSKKNYNFSIAKIDIYGDKNLSNKIARNLNNINKLNNSNKIIELKIDTSYNKIISSKDDKGDPKTFSIEVVSTVNIISDKFNEIRIFKESSNYNSRPSKFDLKKYEKYLINNMIKKISEELIQSLQILL